MITKYHIRDMHHDCNLGNAVMDGERSAEDLQFPGIHNTIFRIDVLPDHEKCQNPVEWTIDWSW